MSVCPLDLHFALTVWCHVKEKLYEHCKLSKGRSHNGDNHFTLPEHPNGFTPLANWYVSYYSDIRTFLFCRWIWIQNSGFAITHLEHSELTALQRMVIISTKLVCNLFYLSYKEHCLWAPKVPLRKNKIFFQEVKRQTLRTDSSSKNGDSFN